VLSLCLVSPALLFSQAISGTVEDSSGAVVAGARIEINGGDLAQPLVLASDGLGKFESPELKAGAYTLRVLREGFEPLVRTVDLKQSAQLQLTLVIAKERVSISVTGKSAAFANSDSFYRQLRDLGLGQTFRLDNFTLECDAATFRFQKGTLTFLQPVNGVVTGAIFIGEARFNLKPVTPLDAHELSRRTGATEAEEDVTEAVFRFTADGRLKFLPGLSEPTEPSSLAHRCAQELEGESPPAARGGFRFLPVLAARRNHG
jgi:hypothetical protein